MVPKIEVSNGGVLVLVGAAALVFLAWGTGKTVDNGIKGLKNLASGDNALTQNAENAAGEKVTAYEGHGIPGTLGAAANWASGGRFASAGEWMGGNAYDLTHADPVTGKWWWQ